MVMANAITLSFNFGYVVIQPPLPPLSLPISQEKTTTTTKTKNNDVKGRKYPDNGITPTKPMYLHTAQHVLIIL